LLEEHRVADEPPAQWLLILGAEVRGEEVVELPRRLLARAGRAGESDGVMHDVVGVHGHGALDVARSFRHQVPLHQRDHFMLFHRTNLRIGPPQLVRTWYHYDMTLSRQDQYLTGVGRTNQKTRTRAALLQSATELVREGRPPSMPEAAERALISLATAYRYFRTAEELWEDAALYSSTLLVDYDEL